MTKSQLITLLDTIPDDANIVVQGYQDDILGEYRFSEDISFHEDTAHRLDRGGDLHMTICNYADMPHKKETVWVLS